MHQIVRHGTCSSHYGRHGLEYTFAPGLSSWPKRVRFRKTAVALHLGVPLIPYHLDMAASATNEALVAPSMQAGRSFLDLKSTQMMPALGGHRG